MGRSWCPRCGSDLTAPSALSSSWRCSRHGPTLPLTEFGHLDPSTIDHINEHADVPLWFPDPVPRGWQLCGLAGVGDSRSGLRATVASFRGPAPLGGVGEWLIVAEEPGIGLGAAYAGSQQTEPPQPDDGAPTVKIAVRGHPAPLWPVGDAAVDRSAYLGEAAGIWLWLISIPADAGYAVLDDLGVSDIRHNHVQAVDPGARSQHLRPFPR
jgi:hypothetical protein